MAIALKLVMGTGASVVLITATERGRFVPLQPVAVKVAEKDFIDRYPIMILPPSDEWRAKAQPVKQDTQIEPPSFKRVQSGHNRKLRATCRKVYYSIREHRYWRCRR